MNRLKFILAGITATSVGGVMLLQPEDLRDEIASIPHAELLAMASMVFGAAALVGGIFWNSRFGKRALALAIAWVSCFAFGLCLLRVGVSVCPERIPDSLIRLDENFARIAVFSPAWWCATAIGLVSLIVALVYGYATVTSDVRILLGNSPRPATHDLQQTRKPESSATRPAPPRRGSRMRWIITACLWAAVACGVYWFRNPMLQELERWQVSSSSFREHMTREIDLHDVDFGTTEQQIVQFIQSTMAAPGETESLQGTWTGSMAEAVLQSDADYVVDAKSVKDFEFALLSNRDGFLMQAAGLSKQLSQSNAGRLQDPKGTIVLTLLPNGMLDGTVTQAGWLFRFHAHRQVKLGE